MRRWSTCSTTPASRGLTRWRHADDVAVVTAPVTAAAADVPPAPDEDTEADDGDSDFEGFDGGCLKAALLSDIPITADSAI